VINAAAGHRKQPVKEAFEGINLFVKQVSFTERTVMLKRLWLTLGIGWLGAVTFISLTPPPDNTQANQLIAAVKQCGVWKIQHPGVFAGPIGKPTNIFPACDYVKHVR
jgi:hypothetical protein